MKLLKLMALIAACIFIVHTTPSFAANATRFKKKIPQVEKLERAPNLFKSEHMFFSAQPSIETLEWLKSQDVDLVINLRSESENDDFAETAFNEKEWVEKLGMKYISIPIDGYNSYTPENVQKLAKSLDSKYDNVLIHCSSCNRVSDFMMAYLVNYKNYKLSQAIEFGEQLKFRFPLEYLLKDEIDWTTK